LFAYTVWPALPAQASGATDSSDYPNAQWNPASPQNYEVAERPDSSPIQYIVLHTIEGSYASGIARFKNPASQVSAHYVISRTGQTTQMVHDQDIAWHAGNPQYNAQAIGIEHEAYVKQPGSFTDAMYRASAALTRYLCLEYGIPMDRQHIIGHNEVPDPNDPDQFGGADHHTDPGPYWNWNYYLQLVTAGGTKQPQPPSGHRHRDRNEEPFDDWNQEFGGDSGYKTHGYAIAHGRGYPSHSSPSQRNILTEPCAKAHRCRLTDHSH
jgi:N-acetyl-anhydromuramyl-L-alanine amidase AmpD